MSNPRLNHKKDPFYRKSKEKGYRARSAFKLIEIQKKFNIFKRAFYILDLGSAPGSWLQVAKEFAIENLAKYNDKFYNRNHFKIMGVDNKKLTPIEDVKILSMDVTNQELRNEIKEYYDDEKLDLIISDASITKSGNKFSDQARQIKLCYKILTLNDFLKKKGNFVLKCFQGKDYEDLYTELKRRFIIVKSFKPQSTYKKSNEIYVIGLKKK